MNKFKSIISNRFGGDLYKELLKVSAVKKEYANEQGCLEKALLKRKSYLIAALFLGNHKMTIKYRKYLFKVLSDIYSSKEDANLLDFNGIYIPKPQTNDDIVSFAAEFLGHFMYNTVSNKTLCDMLNIQGPYENGEVAILKDDIFIDAGANIGLNSAVAGKKGALVHAFEPNKLIIDRYLSVTAKYNPNIQVHNYALYDKEDVLKFSVGNNISAGALSTLKNSEKSCREMDVQAITLDSFVNKCNIPQIDFIKADIEGAERNMLMGAKNVLLDFAPKLSICKYHLPDDPEVIRDIILSSNHNYIINEKFDVIYAHVPNRKRSNTH